MSCIFARIVIEDAAVELKRRCGCELLLQWERSEISTARAATGTDGLLG